MNKLLILSLLIVTGIASSFAVADAKKQLKDMTCEDFLGIDDQYKPKVVYWASAYTKNGKPEDTVVDIEGTEKVVPMIMEVCAQTSKESFWEKLKGEWHKVDMDTKHDMEKMKEKVKEKM